MRFRSFLSVRITSENPDSSGVRASFEPVAENDETSGGQLRYLPPCPFLADASRALETLFGDGDGAVPTHESPRRLLPGQAGDG